MNSITIAFNILRRISKEKSVFIAQVLSPVLIGLVMFSVLSAGNVPKKDLVGILNNDTGSFGSILALHLKSQNEYNIELLGKEELEGNVKSKKAAAGIIIPDNFSQAVDEGKVPEVSLLIINKSITTENLKNTINLLAANLSKSYSVSEAMAYDRSGKESIVGEIFKETDKGSAGTTLDIISDKKNIGGELTVFGFFIMFILQFATLGVGLILEDKKGKTFMRTYCAPVKNHEVVAGNLIANFLMGLFMIGVFLILAKTIYNINVSFSIFIVLLACLITAIGYAIGISAIIKDNEKFIAIAGPVSGIMCVLGGCFIPFSMLPEAM